MATQYTPNYSIPYPQLHDPTPQWTADQIAAMVAIDTLIQQRETEFTTHAADKTAHSEPYEELVVVDAGLVTGRQVTLAAIPVDKSEVIAQNGIVLVQGAAEDYTIASDVVTFEAGCILTVGDVLLFKYWS